MAGKQPAVPEPRPGADSEHSTTTSPHAGSHASKVKKVIRHSERHGETAHHDEPEAKHGFGSLAGGPHHEY